MSNANSNLFFINFKNIKHKFYISKFKPGNEVIEKYLIELTNDLPHRLMAIRKEFAYLTKGAKKELLQSIVNSIRMEMPGYMNVPGWETINDIKNFEDEDLVNLIKFCKNYLQMQLHKVTFKDIEIKVEKIKEIQEKIPKFYKENSHIVEETLKTVEIDQLRKMILQEDNRYADPDPKNPIKINKIFDFCTKENVDCQEKFLEYVAKIEELETLQLKAQHEKIDHQRKLQSISKELEEIKIKDNLLEKEIYKLQDEAKDDIEKLNLLKPKFIELNALRQEIQSVTSYKKDLFEGLQLISSDLRSKAKEIGELVSKKDCLSDIIRKNEQLMLDLQENGIQNAVDTVRNIFENILLKKFATSDQENYLIGRIHQDVADVAELGVFFSVNDAATNKKNIDFIEKSGVCETSIGRHTLTSLRSDIIDTTIRKHLACLTENINFCLYDKIDRKLIKLREHSQSSGVPTPELQNDSQIEQDFNSVTTNPLDSEIRMYNNPLFKLQRLYDNLDQKNFSDQLEDFARSVEEATDVLTLEEEKELLEVQASHLSQEGIVDAASSITADPLTKDIDLHNVTDHEKFMATLGDMEAVVQVNLKNAKDLASLILGTLQEAKRLDPEQQASNPEFFTDALARLSNELPHKIALLSSGGESFF